MIVAVTGGRGLIGRNVIEKFLSQGFIVRALSRSLITSDNAKLKWFIGSLDSSEKVLDDLVRGANIVCHCAGEIKDESQFIKTNYQGTINIASAAVRLKVKRFIHISSVGVYGNNLSGHIDETQALHAMNAYEKSKIMADEWLINLKSKDMDIIILRPSVVFDIDMLNQSLKNWIKAIYFGRFFFVGRKNSRVNYVHVKVVEDAISSIAVSTLPKKINVYNLSDSITVKSFVSNVCIATNAKYPKVRLPLFFIIPIAICLDFLAAISNRKFALTVSRVKALSSNVNYDSSKIKKDLNFIAKEPVNISLQKVSLYWVNEKKMHSFFKNNNRNINKENLVLAFHF